VEPAELDSAPAGYARRDLKQAGLIAGALLAIYVVAHLALLWRFPWFVDETYFAALIQQVQGDPAQRFAALVDHKGLVISWVGALLVSMNVTPMAAIRLISVVSGAVAAGATGFIVWRWRASLRSALLAAGLVAFVPYMFVHDSVGIYDPFVAAGSMVALALQLELARRSRLDMALLLGFTWGVLILAKPTGVLAILLLPLSLALFDWHRNALGRRLAAWGALVALAFLIALCMYALTRLSPLAYTAEPQNHRTLAEFFDSPFGTFRRVAPDAADAMWGYLTPPGVVLAGWGLVRTAAARDRLGLVVAGWALAAIAAFLLLTDTAYPRYGLQAVPPLCILIAIGAEDLWVRAWCWAGRWPVVFVAGVATVPMLLLDARVLLSPNDAPYPGLDRAQYVTLVSNREPVHEAVQVILRRVPKAFPPETPPAQRTVAGLGGWPWAATLALNGTYWDLTPRFMYVDDWSDPTHIKANEARFVIIEGAPPTWVQLGGAELVQSWSRPGGGLPVTLYDRGP
jgi:hypothetical protein